MNNYNWYDVDVSFTAHFIDNENNEWVYIGEIEGSDDISHTHNMNVYEGKDFNTTLMRKTLEHIHEGEEIFPMRENAFLISNYEQYLEHWNIPFMLRKSDLKTLDKYILEEKAESYHGNIMIKEFLKLDLRLATVEINEYKIIDSSLE